MVSRLVQNTLRIMAEGEDETADPNRKFLEDRGLTYDAAN
jgi:hypothetical protein